MTDALPGEFEQILEVARCQTGVDFAAYKPAGIVRRLRKTMQRAGVEEPAHYAARLQEHPDEVARFLRHVLIHVTSLFRDPPAWRALVELAMPPILARLGPDEPVRVWSAGCATGEEPYGLALMLADVLGDDAVARRIRIYATDVDAGALAAAREARWDETQLAAVPSGLRARWFTREGNHWMLDRALRRTVIFGAHDLLRDPPIGRVDLVACRNTLMYFTATAQAQVLARFRRALKPGGFLFLGKAEYPPPGSTGFDPVNFPARLFVRAADGIPRPFPAAGRHANVRTDLDRVMLAEVPRAADSAIQEPAPAGPSRLPWYERFHTETAR